MLDVTSAGCCGISGISIQNKHPDLPLPSIHKNKRKQTYYV